MLNTISNLLDTQQFSSPLREAQQKNVGKSAMAAKTPDQASEAPKLGSQKFLNQQILKALNQHLGASGSAPVDKLNADDFSPEKVADRILSFVGGVINGLRNIAAPDEEVSSMMQAARDGVEKGFGEARDILDGLGIYNGKISEDAEKTYDLLQDGLDRIEKGDSAMPASSVEAYQSMAYSDQRDLSLEVRTRDGDLVTISLGQQDVFSSSRYAAADASSMLFISEEQRSSRFSLEYRVEGELDEDERNALKQLLEDVDGIAESFYSGNGAEAFEKASSLGYDAEQLASYSLSMSQSQSLQTTSAYRAVSQMNGSAAEAPDRLFKPFADMAGGLRDMFGNGQLLGLLQAPDEAVSGLLGQRIEGDSRFADAFGGLGGQGLGALQGFLGKLVAGAHQAAAQTPLG
jgi:hypothetical protein